MGYSSVRTDPTEKLFSRQELLQNILLLTSIILCLIALANFSICIWIRFDLDFWEWVLEIGWYRYWNVMYIVMVAMVFHAANNALSAYGTFTQNRILLLVSIIIRCIVWIITLIGLVFICIYGVEESKPLIAELDLVFKDLIIRKDTDARADRILVQIQEYVGCCGASGNSFDYINLRKEIPNSCRHPISGNRYGYHCPQVLAWWLEPWTGTLASISLGLCVLDFFVIAATVKLRTYIRMTRETQ